MYSFRATVTSSQIQVRVSVGPTVKVAPKVCVFEVCNSSPGLLGWDYLLSRTQLSVATDDRGTHRHINVMEQTDMSC